MEAENKLKAIQARINGEWDNEYLLKYLSGPLGSLLDDINQILNS